MMSTNKICGLSCNSRGNEGMQIVFHWKLQIYKGLIRCFFTHIYRYTKTAYSCCRNSVIHSLLQCGPIISCPLIQRGILRGLWYPCYRMYYHTYHKQWVWSLQGFLIWTICTWSRKFNHKQKISTEVFVPLYKIFFMQCNASKKCCFAGKWG